MKNSPNLDALLVICKFYFKQANEPELIRSLQSINDWHQFIHLASYHSVRPITYEVLNHFSDEVPADIIDYLQRFAFVQTMQNLRLTSELELLLLAFEESNLRVVPQKGLLFMNSFYGSSMLRENENIDLLVHTEDFDAAITFLTKANYEVKLKSKIAKMPQLNLTKSILDTYGLKDLEFIKGDITIALNWSVQPEFTDINFDCNKAFEQVGRMRLFNKECLLPSPESQLLMMTASHGGEESWLKLKHICDLMAFYQKFETKLYWKSAFASAKEQQLQQALGVGLTLLQKHFDVKNTKVFELRKPIVCDRILSFWNEGKHWSELGAKLKYQSIRNQITDNSVPSIKVYQNIFKSISTTAHSEKSETPIPKAIKYLNLGGKVLTFMLKRTFILLITKSL